jgi:hypothetical protein
MSIAATIRENLMIALRPIRLTILAVIAAARRRDRREHTAGYRIDPLDAILGDLKQVLAVEGRSCVRGDIRSVFPLAGSKAFSLSPALHR